MGSRVGADDIIEDLFRALTQYHDNKKNDMCMADCIPYPPYNCFPSAIPSAFGLLQDICMFTTAHHNILILAILKM